MVVGRSIFNAEGYMLLKEGITLTDTYILRLKEWEIAAIYIRTGLMDVLTVPEPVCEEIRVRSIKTLQVVLAKTTVLEYVDIGKIKEVANEIVQEILKNRDTLIHLNDIRRYDEYTFAHSVHVAIYSSIIALALGYPEQKLMEVALGALLHDIGKMLIAKEILNKPGALSADEMEIMKLHSRYGFEILRKQPEMPLLAAHVAFQHHEKLDGSGYPRGIDETEIHEYAKIVAVADVYDALTSDRPYNKAILPHEAYEIIMASVNNHLDAEIVVKFFKHVAIYPVGSMVQLNTGEIGIISKVMPDLQFRPVVTVIAGAKGGFAKAKKQIDLSERLTVFIAKVFTEKEVLSMI
jgi:putative nucleotidyltransferase with HDIG domain